MNAVALRVDDILAAETSVLHREDSMPHITRLHATIMTLGVGLLFVACASPEDAISVATEPPQKMPTATVSAPEQPVTSGPTATQSPDVVSAFAPTPTPQPFVGDAGALPAGARARLGIGYILASDLSPDGAMFALGTSTGIYVYRVEGFEQVWRRFTNYPVSSIQWSPDGTRLLTGIGDSGGPGLWDAATGIKLGELGGWYGGVWSPDGLKIAVGFPPDIASDRPGGVLIYDGIQGLEQSKFIIPADTWEGTVVGTIAWSPDAQIVAADVSDTIYLWDVRAEEVLRSLDASSWAGEWWNRTSSRIAFSPDGNSLSVAEAFNDVVRIWDVESGDLSGEIETGGAVSISWSPDGRQLASAGSELVVADTSGWELIYATRVGSARTDRVNWSPDGTRLGLVSFASIDVVNASTGERVSEESLAYGDYIQSQAHWLPDSQRMIISTFRDVLLWNTQTDEIVQSFSAQVAADKAVWMPDSKTLILSGPQGYHFWDTETKSLLDSIPTDADIAALDELFSSTAVAGDGRMAYGYRDGVRISDPEGKPELMVHPDGFQFGAVVWSPDSSLLATGSMGGVCGDGPLGGGCFNRNASLEVWDGVTGIRLLQKTYPDTGIASVAWSPNGTLLALGLAAVQGRFLPSASGLVGNEVVVIDSLTGDERLTLSGHSGNVLGLAFSPDGDTLASVSSDGTVILWAVAP